MSIAPAHRRVPTGLASWFTACCCGAVVLLSARAVAHEALAELIQHRATVRVARDHIDIQLCLAFSGGPAAKERRRLDQDGNGRISATEIASHLQFLSDAFEHGLRVSAQGRALRVLPLYDPELDLACVNEAGSAPLTLRLSFFCRLDEPPKKDAVFEIEDLLWKEAPALYFLDAEGRDGIAVAALKRLNPLSNPCELRVLRVKCTGKTPPTPAKRSKCKKTPRVRGSWRFL